MGNKTKNIIAWIIAVIGFGFLAYILVGGILLKRQLDNNLESTNAVVIDQFHSIRQTNYFCYSFYVDTIQFEGSGYYYPNSDTFGVGDSIEIVYSSVNPSNNEPKRQYRRHSIIKP